MKLPLITITKTLVALIAVVFVIFGLTANSKSSLASSEVMPQRGGAEIYAASCARCHGSDGRAQTAKGKQTGATDFTSAKWQPDDARSIRVITNGKGKMSAFKGTLSAEEIKAVAAYIRGFKQ